MMDGALSRLPPSSRHTAARCCSTPATASWPSSVPTRPREDDAERAVRCGLALLELGKVLGAEVQAAHGHAASTCAWASTPAACCSAAASMPRAASAASPSTSPRAWSRLRRPGACASATTPTPRCAACSTSRRRRRWRSRASTSRSRATWSLRAKPRAFRVGTRGIEGVETRMIGRDAELEALQDAFKRLFVERTRARRRHRGRRRRHRQEPAALRVRGLDRGAARDASSSSAAAPRRRRRASPSACCATSSPGASRSPTTTASRRRGRRSKQGIVPLFLHDDGPDLAEGHAHLLGHLIGIDWRDSRHVSGILDDARQIRNRALPRRGAAVPPHRLPRTAARSCCSSKTCTGPTTRASTSSTTWPRSTATCRC